MPRVDPTVYLRRDLEEADFHDLPFGSVAVFTKRSPDRGDDPNEDAVAIVRIDDDGIVVLVADGLGGMRNGDEAAAVAIKSVVKEIKRGLGDGRSVRGSIIDGFEAANRAILDAGKGMATTLSVVEIREDSIRPFHVGDSPILLVGQRGKIKLQPVVHSVVGYAVESGVLDERDAMEHEDRHIVSNVVGAPDMRIDVGSTFHMAKRDSVVVASDGLFDNLHTDEIVERVRRGQLRGAMSRLAEDASHRMRNPTDGHPSKLDDLTFAVFRRSTGG